MDPESPAVGHVFGLHQPIQVELLRTIEGALEVVSCALTQSALRQGQDDRTLGKKFVGILVDGFVKLRGRDNLDVFQVAAGKEKLAVGFAADDERSPADAERSERLLDGARLEIRGCETFDDDDAARSGVAAQRRTKRKAASSPPHRSSQLQANWAS